MKRGKKAILSTKTVPKTVPNHLKYGILIKHRLNEFENEIGKSMGVTRERVRQLQNKAIKRMGSGATIDVTGILIVLCACYALSLDAMKYLEQK